MSCLQSQAIYFLLDALLLPASYKDEITRCRSLGMLEFLDCTIYTHMSLICCYMDRVKALNKSIISLPSRHICSSNSRSFKLVMLDFHRTMTSVRHDGSHAFALSNPVYPPCEHTVAVDVRGVVLRVLEWDNLRPLQLVRGMLTAAGLVAFVSQIARISHDLH